MSEGTVDTAPVRAPAGDPKKGTGRKSGRVGRRRGTEPSGLLVTLRSAEGQIPATGVAASSSAVVEATGSAGPAPELAAPPRTA
ncbi:MAG: hypothetical protein WBS16_06825, partial [Thermoplasmata archaeon]